MNKAGVIGHPVGHSLSPKLHNYWLEKYKIDGEYKAYDVAPAALARFIKTMDEQGFSGCNVTLPHKEKVMALLDKIDPLAQKVGAVNTIVVQGGKLFGGNTDVVGFYKNTKPHLKAKGKAVILGAGGASRAVIVAIRQMGFKHVVINNRTPEKAQALAKKYSLEVVPWEKRAQALAGCDLLVNTTSLGLAGKPKLEIPLTSLPPHALVTDIVYSPLMTPLLVAARKRGNPVVDGLGMLLYQGAPGFSVWFGKTPSVTKELREFMLSA